jgi:hypothetical protein
MRKEMVFDKKKDSKVIKNLSPSSEKCNKKVDLINKGKEGVDNNGDSIRTVLSDQEYIVFSFREDGSFDVATDSIGAKSESYKSVDGKHENSKLVSRKVHITHSLPFNTILNFSYKFLPKYIVHKALFVQPVSSPESVMLGFCSASPSHQNHHQKRFRHRRSRHRVFSLDF